MTRTIWQGKVTKIPHSDMENDDNNLKLKWIDNKTEDELLMKCVS